MFLALSGFSFPISSESLFSPAISSSASSFSPLSFSKFLSVFFEFSIGSKASCCTLFSSSWDFPQPHQHLCFHLLQKSVPLGLQHLFLFHLRHQLHCHRFFQEIICQNTPSHLVSCFQIRHYCRCVCIVFTIFDHLISKPKEGINSPHAPHSQLLKPVWDRA